MSDYSKGLIYKITTQNSLYVGSCCDFKQREINHKCRLHNENSRDYNIKLYQNIRENNGVWEMNKIKDFPCNSKRELEQEETKIMLELNAVLNEKRAYVTEEEKKEYKKEYYNENRDKFLALNREYYNENRDKFLALKGEKIICECGCEITRNHIARHIRTKKHLGLIKKINM